MKKKVIYISAAVAVVTITAVLISLGSNRLVLNTRAEFKRAEAAASEVEEEAASELRTQLSGSAAAPTANARRTKDALIHQEGHNQVLAIGPVYKPAQQTDRRLEYQVNLNYQINDLKGARAFFNQWIPRYGFLQNESASGQGDGHMTLSVRVRSANLYTALSELDAIGTLAHEQINVVDHTENAVYQQMLAAREQIRLRRRSVAAGQNALASRNWQAAETLLAASEDKELQTRIEEWRINDRVQWATITVQLTMPAVTKPAAIEVPLFQNAFVGFLNLLLLMLYAAIYVVPIAGLIWLGWRASLKIIPALRASMPRA